MEEQKAAGRPGPASSKTPGELQRLSRDLCFEFAQLAEASDDAIRKFAGRWGPLNFEERLEEHISDWRSYSRLAQAILRIWAAHIYVHNFEPSDWQVVCEWLDVPDDVGTGANRTTRAALTLAALNQWLAKARVRVVIVPAYGQKPVLQSQSSTLFGVIALQIAYIVQGVDELIVCSGCRRSFRPTRGQCHGTRRYCRGCRREGVPQRDAARDFRRRKAGVLETN